MNKPQIIKLRPGILVSLRSEVRGGVSYVRTPLDPTATPTAEEKSAVERWETTKVTTDAEEHTRAEDARTAATAPIRKLCMASAFGLLCPIEREAELSAAIAQSRAIADAFNESARYTSVRVYVLRGHIATTDEEAAQAIGDEVRELVDAMNAGITALDVEAIREAATKASQIGEMLDATQQETLGEAVKAARSAARAIVKRIQKDGEQAAVVLADIKRGALERARLAFLDLDEPAPLPATAEQLPAIAAQRDLDFDEDVAPTPAQASSGAEVA